MIGIPTAVVASGFFSADYKVGRSGLTWELLPHSFRSEAVFAGSVHTLGLSASRAGMIQDTIFRNAFFTQQM
jgi:hypothetical protein